MKNKRGIAHESWKGQQMRDASKTLEADGQMKIALAEQRKTNS